MSSELIITEKPKAAEKIAFALADTKPKKIRENNVNYYSIQHNNKQILVASAVGHLYGLGEKGGESWKYPVFETEWKPIYKTNKEAKYTKDYINLLKKLGKNASEVTIATDFDVEGEVIGLNVIRFALNREDASRMKFSTLTKPDIVKAYQNKQKSIEWGQAKAGETRHNLDWLYGINLSRALTNAIKNATKQFKVLSIGRVQGPALNFLSEKEISILNFKPKPFWLIKFLGEKDNKSFEGIYEVDKIFDKDKADEVYNNTKNEKRGVVVKVEKRESKQSPPVPFDLSGLQMEASNIFGYSPKKTLQIAQDLYIEGLISYPRTSSQKLPKELNLKNILKELSKQNNYKEKVNYILEKTNVKPKEGKKEDPAHPSIYPTGLIPKNLKKEHSKVYDLIVKRFLAVFGKPAIREFNKITISINNYNFIIKGTRTIEKNWHELYEPYVRFEEIEVPKLNEKDIIDVKKVTNEEKETQPPKRYTDASIIKELEKRNIGTKATRAEIISQLRNRGYIVDKSIRVTELGLKMIEILKEELPDIIDERMTREFEEEMEKIRTFETKPEDIINKAIDILKRILKDFKDRELEVGKKLAEASKIVMERLKTIAPCPNCENGHLVIKYSKKVKKNFIACNNYPNCKTIFNIPQYKHIKSLEENAVDKDGKIWVLVGNSENNLRKICINQETPEEEEKELGHKKYEEEGMICPVCKKGKMVLRKSFYGEFLGCSNYPECKTMMKIVKGKVDTKNIINNSKNNKTSIKKKKIKNKSKK